MTDSLSIPFCNDVQQFLLAQLTPVLKQNDCLVHLGCTNGDLAYELHRQVGSAGRVIGLESENETIYAVFREHNQRISDSDWDNLFFFHSTGKDLRIDQYRLSTMLRNRSINSLPELQALMERVDRYFDANPVIDDNSADYILVTENLNQLTQTALCTLATDIQRVLKPEGFCSVLLPAGQTRANRQLLEHFTVHLNKHGVFIQQVSEHHVTSGCCDENHYLFMQLKADSEFSSASEFLNEKIDQLLKQKISETETTCSPTSGCC